MDFKMKNKVWTFCHFGFASRAKKQFGSNDRQLFALLLLLAAYWCHCGCGEDSVALCKAKAEMIKTWLRSAQVLGPLRVQGARQVA